MKNHEQALASVRSVLNKESESRGPLVVLCAQVVAFVPGEFLEHSDGIRAFFDVARKHLEGHAAYFLVDGEGRFKKARQDTLDLIDIWTSEAVAPRGVYGLDLECGPTKDGLSDRAFQMYFDGGDPGFIRMVVPAEQACADPAGFLADAIAALRHLRFASAYAGFSANMVRGTPAPSPSSTIATASRRFSGLDLGRPLMFARMLTEHVKRVSWLTGVGNDLLPRVGGIDGVRKALAGDAIVHSLDHGVLIQAGDHPRLGDVNRQEDMTPYEAVGRVLTPLRIPPSVLGVYNGVGGTDNTREWLARFDAK